MIDPSFAQLLEERRRVAAAFVNGDPKPLRDISSTSDPATILGPGGGAEQGAARVLEVNEAASRQLHGGTAEIEILHSAVRPVISPTGPGSRARPCASMARISRCR